MRQYRLSRSSASHSHPACVKLVASLEANGTSSIRASVLARRVFPLPVGPLTGRIGNMSLYAFPRGKHSHHQHIALLNDHIIHESDVCFLISHFLHVIRLSDRSTRLLLEPFGAMRSSQSRRPCALRRPLQSRGGRVGSSDFRERFCFRIGCRGQFRLTCTSGSERATREAAEERRG